LASASSTASAIAFSNERLALDHEPASVKDE